jgi:hypothetical protein
VRRAGKGRKKVRNPTEIVNRFDAEIHLASVSMRVADINMCSHDSADSPAPRCHAAFQHAVAAYRDSLDHVGSPNLKNKYNFYQYKNEAHSSIVAVATSTRAPTSSSQQLTTPLFSTVLVARMEKDLIRVKQLGVSFTTQVLILFCHASRHNSGLGWTKAREYSFQV